MEKELVQLVEKAVRQHKKWFEKWEYGKVVRYWIEEDGEGKVVCIQYENGKWYHYKHIELGTRGMEFY